MSINKINDKQNEYKRKRFGTIKLWFQNVIFIIPWQNLELQGIVVGENKTFSPWKSWCKRWLYTLLDLSKEILSISEEIKVLPWWGQKLSIRN